MTTTGNSDKPRDPRRVTLMSVRLTYVYLDKAQENDDDGGLPKFKARILIPKDRKAQLDALKAAVVAAQEKAKAKVGEEYTHKPLRHGNKVLDREGNHYPGHKDMIFLNAKSKDRPACALADGRTLMDPVEIKREFYPGVIADVIISAYFYEHRKGGRGVAWTLDVVRKRRDAPRLDSRATVAALPPVELGDKEDDYWDFLAPIAAPSPAAAKGWDEEDDDGI